jgi:hypothetical protein
LRDAPFEDKRKVIDLLDVRGKLVFLGVIPKHFDQFRSGMVNLIKHIFT